MDASLMLWTVISTAFLAYIIKYIIWRLTHRFPPGPWSLPLLGYAPFLSNNPSVDYLRLGEKYGPVVGFRLGTRYTVVVNDFYHLKEAFNRDEFSDRPPGLFQLSEKHTHLGEMNGWEWKETRKLMANILRNLGVGKNKIEEKIMEELQQLISTVEKAGPEAEINVLDLTYLPLLNVILTIACGRPFDDGDLLLKDLAQFNDDVLRMFNRNYRTLCYPFLKPLIKLKKLLLDDMPAATAIEEFVRKGIIEHKRDFDENNLEDFMSYYIKEMRERVSKNASSTSLNDANLHGNSQTLLFAGTDTARTTLSWILLHLAEHQVAQQKIYQEIVGLVGKEKMPSWNDKDCLPYTEAFILESARIKTMGPAEDAHWSGQDGQIGGYFIPKDTVVIGNILAVHMDKKLWGDPETFRPERFLSQDGKKTVTPDYWIPFLTGKRSCPGSKLANMQLFLFTTSLVQKFRVVPPKSGLSLETQFFVLLFPKKPVVSFEPRN